MCYGYNMCFILRKHLYDKFIHTFIHKFYRSLWYISDYQSLVYLDDVFMIWIATKAKLMTLIFFDTMLYKDKNNNIQTILYHKPTDQQALLHTKLEKSRSLKSSISQSQAVSLKTIYSTALEFDKNCAVIKQKFLESKYKESFWIRKSGVLIELKEKNYSKVKKKQQKAEFHY